MIAARFLSFAVPRSTVRRARNVNLQPVFFFCATLAQPAKVYLPHISTRWGSEMKLIVAVILFVGAAFVASADTVVMKNGDRLTGTVVKSDGKQLTVKTD